MALAKLQLSLQFGDIPYTARHRAALPRHMVTRCIRHALDADAEMTVRIVDAEEGRALNNSYRGKDYATNVLTFDQHIPICGDFRFQHRILSQAAHQNARSPVHEPLGEALMQSVRKTVLYLTRDALPMLRIA